MVCLTCGEAMDWCKYDQPFDECETCGSKLTTNKEACAIEIGAYEDAGRHWDEQKVRVFGVWTTSDQVKQLSERIRRDFKARHPRKWARLLKEGKVKEIDEPARIPSALLHSGGD